MKATAEATDDELVNSTLSRLDRHFSEGVTTCEIKSGYGSTIENELRLLRIINKIKKIHHSDVIPTCQQLTLSQWISNQIKCILTLLLMMSSPEKGKLIK